MGDRRWTPLQKGVVLVSFLNTAWALAGLIANPSFATRDAATSVQVLGIDMNGWHAGSGLLVFVPGFYRSSITARWASGRSSTPPRTRSSTSRTALYMPRCS